MAPGSQSPPSAVDRRTARTRCARAPRWRRVERPRRTGSRPRSWRTQAELALHDVDEAACDLAIIVLERALSSGPAQLFAERGIVQQRTQMLCEIGDARAIVEHARAREIHAV